MDSKHIEITEKRKCCGCSACVQACPQKCISFNPDKHGFKYPIVDTSSCVNCGLCVNVCPEIHNYGERIPLKSFGIHKNDQHEIEKSSSAGVFYLLSSEIIKRGGVVFGARYKDSYQGVCHDYTDSIDGLVKFQQSKYVESDINEAFSKCLSFLKVGRQVLFSGTPCQICGLKNFLKNDFDNLLTVDLICHGVPSQLVWKEYINQIVQNLSADLTDIADIDFRDRRDGWLDFGTSIKVIEDGKEKDFYQSFRESPYFEGFMRNLFIRSSCFDCPVKLGSSGADITLGDFWGIKKICPTMDTRNSVAIALGNTVKGTNAIESLSLNKFQVPYKDILISNPNLYQNTQSSPMSDYFWNKFHECGINALQLTLKKIHGSRYRKLLSMAIRIAKKITR